MVTWTNSGSSNGAVYYSTYDVAFESWAPAVALSNAPTGGNAMQTALAADESGDIHATWQQRTSSTAKYQILYSKYTGTSWSTPVKISLNDAEAAEEATIEVDSKGYLWVVYNNDGAGVGKEWIYAVRSTDNGATWSTTADTLHKTGTLGTSIEVARVAIAPGPNGKLAAIYDNSIGGSLARRETYVNLYDGTKWLGDVRISDTTSVDRDHNRYSTIAIDKNSNVYAFYIQDIISASDTRPRKIAMHKLTWGQTWSTTATSFIETGSKAYRELSAVADSNGYIHLAYRTDNPADTTYSLDDIVYTCSKDGGVTWRPRITLNRTRRDGGYVTIANRVRRAYGVDIAWRESRDTIKNDQDTTTIMYTNIPYNVASVQSNVNPHAYELLSNYPNPFNPSTTIRYTVNAKGFVEVSVLDVLGKEINVLIGKEHTVGSYTTQWNGSTSQRSKAPSGVYFVRLKTALGVQTIKTILLK
jgi:hypothetical protein